MSFPLRPLRSAKSAFPLRLARFDLRIERAANRPKNFDNNDELESAISDIQLLGTIKQAKLAEQFASEIANKSNANTDELLLDLRKDLRAELGLEQLVDEITYLRLDKN